MLYTFIAFLAVFTLAIMRIPLAISMLVVGATGIGLLKNWVVMQEVVANTIYETGYAYTLSVIPLFILMGNFVAKAGFANELYHFAYTLVGHLKGGLAYATVIACAGFGAICGSSIATAATMSKVSYPSMQRLGYKDELSFGVIASGGTLGIMIPPSTILVIYGIITNTHIGKLFAAGVLPGILTALVLMGTIYMLTFFRPHIAPKGQPTSWKERFNALKKIWPVLLLIFIVLGGIYGGFFTSTEGAGVGAFAAFLFAWLGKKLTFLDLKNILLESGRSTAILFLLLIGASVFSNFINFTSLPTDMVGWLTALNLSPILTVFVLMVIYIVLGTVMEELTMVLLTIPLFLPIIVSLHYDPIWFGVLIVFVIQIGLISPPVGMNLFVLKSLFPQVPFNKICNGCWPFVGAIIFALIICVLLPEISLWLPRYVS